MHVRFLIATALALASAHAHAQGNAPTRGELLYSTHCIACHSTQMHWRDKRVATDWPTLKEQMGLWQARAMLGWTEDDVTEVARHLNDSIYHYPRDDSPGSRARPPG
jgi:mono/diheme cytochrome c family protein